MTLKKQVNDQEIICSPEEEARIRAFWAETEKYPEFLDAIIDHPLKPHIINMPRARELQKEWLKRASEWKVKELTEKLEMAQEDGDDDLCSLLLKQRKEARHSPSVDLSNCKTLEDLRAAVPTIVEKEMDQIRKGIR